jgi:multidrug transporter EmrE-like cation transporter
MTTAWIALAGAILASLTGQVLLKAGTLGDGGFVDQVFRWQTILGLGCYGGSAFLYILALRQIPMSVALPSTAVSYVAIAVIGYLVFGEPLGAQKIAAIGLICVGVVLLATA